jgi:hypothetical protein
VFAHCNLSLQVFTACQYLTIIANNLVRGVDKKVGRHWAFTRFASYHNGKTDIAGIKDDLSSK